MIVSINEIESLALKASRGAGYTWGLAEDAAVATRWLAEYGIDSIGLLARLLARSETECAACPIRLGTRLADGKKIAWDFEPLPLVAAPAFLVPFLAQVAALRQVSITLAWEGAHISILPQASGPVRLGLKGNVMSIRAQLTVLRPVDLGECGADALPHPGERTVDAQDWQHLMVLEERTYVPASALSRQTGAGAGESDND